MTLADETHRVSASTRLPLVVDLDGTLIRSDVFADAMLRFGFAAPWRAPELLGWLMRGRAHAKHRLAECAACDPETLPYDERVLDWLREERAAGRRIVLATASNGVAARAIADYLGLFDDVFASDEVTNLKSKAKAARLAEAFPDGFVYAGNEGADFAVWRSAKQAVVVNASRGLTERVRRAHEVEREFERERGPLRAFVKAIRPQQWVKNLLVFLPLLIGGGWMLPEAWIGAFLAFWALSFTASAVYLINDAADIDADRRHPRKKMRPFAAGHISPLVGLAGAAVLAPLGLAIAAYAGVLPLVLTYLAITTLYSFWLKRVVLIDVFVLASLYTIRIVIGGAASGFLASDWLLAFSCFFFLSLALVKRVAETRDMALRGGGKLGGRGYRSSDTNVLTIFGIGSGLVAALVLALYLQQTAIVARFSAPLLLWVLPAVEMYWICRVWMKTDRGEMHDDPIVFAVRDKTSWLLGAIAAAGFAAALTVPAYVLRGFGLHS
jgi:4-hydroxybenzoate polyprenyltransferase/phosphoserine phosphatase